MQEDTSGILFSDLFKRIEEKMDANFEKFEKKLDDIERRVADIESAGYQLSDMTSSSSSSDSTSGTTRKKRSPSDLQVAIS